MNPAWRRSGTHRLGTCASGTVRPRNRRQKEDDMTTGKPMTRILAATVVSLGIASGPASAETGDATVIHLTQTACQFVESENGVDHGYVSKRKADCETLNAETGADRLAKAEVLKLEPGKYIFRVTNKNVPYELGFWMREADYNWKNPLHKVSKLSISGGGLVQGATADYAVELKPGAYLYSCPLNPTPNYMLQVGG
jgi:hypothetical protein